ncbi:hypothetical protein DSUL_20444 [Desulfovibrionales bacterium]
MYALDKEATIHVEYGCSGYTLGIFFSSACRVL